MVMRWKLRVKDKAGNTHVHRFPDAEAAYRHWTLYQSDIDRGFYEHQEMWKLTKLHATGDDGEEVWQLVQMYPKRD